MGYKIIYFDEAKKSYLRRIILSLMFFVGFMIWTFHNWGEGRALILEVMFPVTGFEAENAIHVMIQDLRSGNHLGESIATFIQTVFPKYTEGLY